MAQDSSWVQDGDVKRPEFISSHRHTESTTTNSAVPLAQEMRADWTVSVQQRYKGYIYNGMSDGDMVINGTPPPNTSNCNREGYYWENPCTDSLHLLQLQESFQSTHWVECSGTHGHAHYTKSQPAWTTKHVQSTKGMFLHKFTPSILKRVAVLPNS